MNGEFPVSDHETSPQDLRIVYGDSEAIIVNKDALLLSLQTSSHRLTLYDESISETPGVKKACIEVTSDFDNGQVRNFWYGRFELKGVNYFEKEKMKSIFNLGLEDAPEGELKIAPVWNDALASTQVDEEHIFTHVSPTMDWVVVSSAWPIDRQEVNRINYASAFLKVFMHTANFCNTLSKAVNSNEPVLSLIDLQKTYVLDAFKQRPLGLRAEVIEPKYNLDDIGGLSGVKEQIRDISAWFEHPDIMGEWGAEAPQGVLFVGEPGNGKTMLAHALANEIDADFWAVDSTLYGGHLGDAQNKMKNVFDAVKNHPGRVVLFFDEMDGLLGKIDGHDTGGGATAERNSVAAIFKTQMNDLAENNPNVLVVAAVNNADNIDETLVRSGRFNYEIYVPQPDDEGRREIVAKEIALRFASIRMERYKEGAAGDNEQESSRSGLSGDIDMDEIIQATEGFSGADLHNVFRMLSTKKARQNLEGFSPVTQEDLMQAIRDFRTGA